MYSRFIFSFLAVLFLVSASVAQAAEGEGSFTRPMTAVDPVMLKGGGTRVTLWGVKPAGNAAVDLKAVALLDDMIEAADVSCKAVGGASGGDDIVARCANHNDDDLGLELLNRGLVVLDRQQDVSSVPAYIDAQKAAHRNAEGIWRQVAMVDEADVPSWLQVLLGLSPVAGLVFVAAVMYYSLKRIETQQREDREQAERKENLLLARERHVLVSTLEAELNDNRNRIEVFLAIYRAMLENLKSKTETPKYQQSGDIVQKHPALSKTVYETSAGKFSLLDMKLATHLSKLYASLPKGQEYINIEPGVPLDSATALVEKVLREAEALLPPITDGIAALEQFVAESKS
jgi:hypothetical protein